MALTTIAGQPSWSLTRDRVSLHLTRLGGHLGPATFRLGRRTVQPFSVAPWAEETLVNGTPGILAALRGDFFCCPFGIDRGRPYRGQATPPHGESCNAPWILKGIEQEKKTTTLRAQQRASFRSGSIRKEVIVRDGHAAIYQRHILTGLAGPLTLGHHPLLKFPAGEGTGLLSFSGLQGGLVFPEPLGVPAQGSYSILTPGARFSRLDRVPQVDGGQADLSVWPARRGYDDLVQLIRKPVRGLAWSAVAFPQHGYAWFSLKNPAQLTSTLLWMSNGGRWPTPWQGRHVGVLGVEEITGCFDYGVAASLVDNPIARLGVPTILAKTARKDLCVPYIMAMAAIPNDFGRITAIEAVPGGVVLRSATAAFVTVPLDTSFLLE